MATLAADMAPARLHSSSIPELSGNQRSPAAHRELVHVEFAGREVKLPRVLHNFLTVIKSIPAERGVRPNSPNPPYVRACKWPMSIKLSSWLLHESLSILVSAVPFTTRMFVPWGYESVEA